MNMNTWPYIAKGVRGPHATISEEKTACRRQPGLRCGCQVHAVLSADVEVAIDGGKQSGSFRCGQLQALDPGLTLCNCVADKSYVSFS